ncbi:septum formation initiator family protein [Maribacter algarum]|uniref:Septum formation initiator family protein n=1 Tax=Maribacter algarum (ex Zhang et al. 2020) TaxID=2578118 RepID=A0A5S3PHT9_9FLAO|nr:septum formation initiator family protein [Maribacter algarum]TMM53844.1 septum formation initiator family protein [Maribacter algarum]
MAWKDFKKSKWFKIATIFSSIYVLILTAFVVWMVFFDTNSLRIHMELKREIDNLEKQKEYLKEQIESDKKIIEKLSDPEELEKFAREQYYLKKKNEEIYLIEYEDSLKLKQKKND